MNPHIFLSYAREDVERVKLLAAALQSLGWLVWWDKNIRAGAAFDNEIESNLKLATCVVVLWSPHSVKSRWVKEEAHEAINRGIYLPCLLEDGVEPPFGLRGTFQTANIAKWSGAVPSADLTDLIEGITALSAPGPSSPNNPLPGPRPRPRFQRFAWLGAALIIVLIAYLLLNRMTRTELPSNKLQADQSALVRKMQEATHLTIVNLEMYFKDANALRTRLGMSGSETRSQATQDQIDRLYAGLWNEVARNNPVSKKAPQRLLQIQPRDGLADPAILAQLSNPDSPKRDAPTRMHEVKVLMYDGASQPKFFVNDRPTQAEYSSPFATFRLPANTYNIRGVYPNRVCYVTVTIPATGVVPATCDLK